MNALTCTSKPTLSDVVLQSAELTFAAVAVLVAWLTPTEEQRSRYRSTSKFKKTKTITEEQKNKLL